MIRKQLFRNKITQSILIVVMAIISICIVSAYTRKTASTEIIHGTCSFLEYYPLLIEPYTYSELIIHDDSGKFLVLHINNQVVAVGQYADGVEIYNIDGSTFTCSEDNVLSEIKTTADPFQDALRLLHDQTTGIESSFSVKHVSSVPYPLWISMGETYIDVIPENNGGCIERIAIGNNADCLRWYILSAEGDVNLFLHACKGDNLQNWYQSLWGELPNGVYELIESCAER